MQFSGRRALLYHMSNPGAKVSPREALRRAVVKESSYDGGVGRQQVARDAPQLDDAYPMAAGVQFRPHSPQICSEV